MLSLADSFSRLFLNASRQELAQLRFTRRRVNPPPWIPKKYHPVRAQLYKDDRRFIEANRDIILPSRSTLDSRVNFGEFGNFHLVPGVSNPPDCRGNVYNRDTSRRIGMVGRKIGMTLQWMNDGTRCLCTMIHFPDNVVLSANDPETWYKHSVTGKQKAFGKRGPLWSQMVGAQNEDSVFYTDEYRRVFERAGVPCKSLMGGFLVSEDAIVKPGTELDVRHFQVGQYVTLSGKTIDWGFQGVMHRWGMKGMRRRNTTKAHRRVGSIGIKGEGKVWLGRCLPGHMGYEWRTAVGYLILRINPIEQVIYVKGSPPGDNGEMLLITDCKLEKRRAESPPFPTLYPDEIPKVENADHFHSKEELQAIYNVTSQDLYHPNLFQFNQRSIVYTEADETKSMARDKSRAKTAQIRKKT